MGRKTSGNDALFSSLRDEKLAKSEATLTKIAEVIALREWDGTVPNQIADILQAAGVEIPAPPPDLVPPACCPKCGNHDMLRVTESYAASHRYDASRHVAHIRVPDEDDGQEDYAAYCRSCDAFGTLEAFGMKLVDWIDDDEDGEEADGE